MKNIIKAEKAYRRIALKKEIQIAKLLKSRGAPAAILRRENILITTMIDLYKDCKTGRF